MTESLTQVWGIKKDFMEEGVFYFICLFVCFIFFKEGVF